MTNTTNTNQDYALTTDEQYVLQLILDNPMLSIKEIVTQEELDADLFMSYLDLVYVKLIPKDIYLKSTSNKLRLYIILKYSKPFAEMLDSWHTTFIDPLFNTKEQS